MPKIPRQPVEAIGDEPFDAAGPYDAKQSMKRQSVEGRAGLAFVVESLFDDYVAQRAQRLNVGLA